jgi:hypothetical protein
MHSKYFTIINYLLTKNDDFIHLTSNRWSAHFSARWRQRDFITMIWLFHGSNTGITEMFTGLILAMTFLWNTSGTSTKLHYNMIQKIVLLNTSLFCQLEQMFISNLITCLKMQFFPRHYISCTHISANMFFLSQKYLLCLQECEEKNLWQVQQISSLCTLPTFLILQFLRPLSTV